MKATNARWLGELQASLEKHNEAFESLLKLIPAKYYLVQDDAEAQVRDGIVKIWRIFLTRICMVVCLQVPEEQQEAEGSEASYQGGL